MAGLFEPKELNIPGFTGVSDLITQQAQAQRTAVAAPSDAALGFADKIMQTSTNELKRSTSTFGSRFMGSMRSTGELMLMGPIYKGLEWAGKVDSPLSGVGLLAEEDRAPLAKARADDAAAGVQAAEDNLDLAKAMQQDFNQRLATPTGNPLLDSLKRADAVAGDTAVSAAQAGKAKAVEQKAEADKIVNDPRLYPTQMWWLNAAQTGYRSALQLGLDAAQAPFIAYALQKEMVTGEQEKSAVREFILKMDKALNDALPGDKARAKDFATELSAGVGSFAGFMVANLLSGGTATMAVGMGAQATQQVRDAEQFDTTVYQRYMALLLGAGIGATEALPIDRMFLRVEAATGGAVSRMLRSSTASGLEEFIQELGQNVGEDVVAKYLYDPNRKMDAGEWLRAGFIGAITGAVGGAVTSAAVRNNAADAADPAQADAFMEQAAAVIAAMDQQQTVIDEILQPTIEDPQAAQAEQAPAPSPVEAASPVAETLSALGIPANPQGIADLTMDQVETALAAAGVTADTVGDITEEQMNAVLASLNLDAMTPPPRGGTQPESRRADGQIELVHWANSARDVLSPASQGTGNLRGEERNRLAGDASVQRVYYGVNPMAEFTPTKDKPFHEPTDGYRKEAGLGRVRHVVRVNQGDLYNWWEDPDKLNDRVDRTLPNSEQVTQKERLIKEAGYKGAYFSRSPHGQVAIVFDDMVPTSVIDDSTGQVLAGEPNDLGAPPPRDLNKVRWTPARPANFADLGAQIAAGTPDAENVFRRPGWAVITAIREDDGPHDSAANRAALARMEKELEGTGAIPVVGAYRGVPQGRSWVVFGGEKKVAEMAARYGQESILTSKGLVFTDGTGRVVPAVHDQTVVGPAAESAEFFSRLPDGTAFTMGLDWDMLSLPDIPKMSTGPLKQVVTAAQQYAASQGLPYQRQPAYVKVDKDRATRIARAYDQMKHDPENPAVKASYQALIDETLAQYQFVKASGLQVEVMQEGQADPYPEGPKQVLEDIRDRNHLWLFPTESGFGSSDADTSGNPLTAPTDEYIGDHRLLANDVFRIVHDFFGHGIEGATFGARGEENAWQAHARLYSEAARPAMTTETRGQNSWVNYGPHGEANRANPRETVYADQKTGLMPAWTWQEGLDLAPVDDIEAMVTRGGPLIQLSARHHAELRDLMDRADEQLSPAAEEVVAAFVAVGRGARSGKGAQSGIMDARPLEQAARANDRVIGELARAFAPVKAALRQIYGDTVKLYRVQKVSPPRDGATTVFGMPKDGARAVLSWSLDPRFSDAWAGVPRPLVKISDTEIAAAQATLDAVGEVKAPGSRYTLRYEGEYVGRDGKTRKSYGVYGSDGFVTDTESVADFVRGNNEWADEVAAEIKTKRADIITADIALDDVVYATDRAGQMEFIVRNDEQSSVFVTPEGEVVDRIGDIEAMTAADIDDQNRISTRFPTQKQSSEDPVAEKLQIGLPAMQANEKAFAHNMQVIKSYPNWPKSDRTRNPDAVAEKAIQHAEDNLLWLYDQVPPEVRERTQNWYDGARRLSAEWGKRYELPDRAVAGVLAAMSPQKDWYTNVSLAERTLDIVAYKGQENWDTAMDELSAKVFPAGPIADLIQRIGGRSLEALAAQGEPLALQALWVRVYDQAHNTPAVHAVTPEGDFLQRAAGSVAWGSLAEIGKALAIIQNPSVDNINSLMGAKHKIRSFYNNIIAPGSLQGDVTIDTHAVAAALLRPLSGNAMEVMHNFATNPAIAARPKNWQPVKNAGATGATGTYGLYAEAYRRAAAKRGVLPRQMQSITWEAVRGLYSDVFKRAPGAALVEDAWRSYHNGKATIDDVRKEIINVTGGIRNPDWYVKRNGIVARALAGYGAGPDGANAPASYPRNIPDDSLPVWSARSVDAGARGGPAGALSADVEAQTANSRPAFKAEQDRPAAGVPDAQQAPATAAADTALMQIAQNLIDLMNLTVRQGRLTLREPGVTGQYSGKTSVIRTKNRADLSTIAHEAGHYLNDDAAKVLDTFLTDNDAILQKIANDLYGGDLTKAPKRKVRREGFAEFFRVYLLNRAYLDVNYPGIGQSFDALLSKETPQLYAGLQAVASQYQTYLTMPSLQVVQGLVVPQTASSGIGKVMETFKAAGGAREWFAEWRKRAMAEVLNRATPLNDLVARALNEGERKNNILPDLRAADDPRVLYRLSRNSGSRANIQIMDGVIPYRSIRPATRSLRDALLVSQGVSPDGNLSTIDEQRQLDFDTYLIALRSIAEYERFQKRLIARPPVSASLGDLIQTVADLDARYGPSFKEAALIVDEYGRALWQKQYDAGLIDQETFTAGLDRGFYAPLQRDMSDRKSALGDSVLTASKAAKRFKGSDRRILSPMQVLLHKTHSVEQAIIQNDVIRAIARLGDVTGAGKLIERVPAHKLVGTKMSVTEIARQLANDPDMSPTDAADLMSLLQGSMDADKYVTQFRATQAAGMGENILFYWDRGDLQAIQLEREGSLDIGKSVIDLVQGAGREIMPVGIDILTMTSSAFRATITSWPDFLLVNFIRDQMSAWMLTDVGYKPFISGGKGIVEEIRQRGYARDYNAAMGTMGGMNSATVHDTRVNRDLDALKKRGYLPQLFGGSGFLGAAQGLMKLTELSETGTRLGLYELAFKRGKAEGLTDYEAAIEASYLATDYIDFGLNGERMTLARRVIPFLNAQMQGLYKMMRTLGGDEVRQRKGMMFMLKAFFKDVNNLPLTTREKKAVVTGRKLWIKMGALSLIGAALTALFKDDEDYQATSEYLRTTGWVVPMGEGRIVYVPKPFELAIVNNIVERAVESASGDTAAMDRLRRGVAQSLTPPMSPPLIGTLVEHAANHDFFTGREIVPNYMQALQPRLQYDERTSSIARWLGDNTNMSPMVIDHYLSGLGASAYRDLRNTMDAVNSDRPAPSLVDTFIVRRFIRDAHRGSTVSQDFWKQASATAGTTQQAYVSYKRLVDEGRDAAAADYLKTLRADDQAYAVLNVHADTDAKRLHPLRRARDIASVISGLRREMVSDFNVEDTSKVPEEDGIPLTRKEKRQLTDLLSELSQREMRNTLILLRTPGWTDKRELPVQPTVDLIRAINPAFAEEFDRRMVKSKAYPYGFVKENWPDVRERATTDREEAMYKDLTAGGKVLRALGPYE